MEVDTEESAGLLISAFYLGEQAYGIPTTCVQEIVRFVGATPVHQAPSFIVGVMNLRGQIVTVFDLAARISLPSLVPSKDNRVIILDWSGEFVGLLVDDVFDVFPVEPSEILSVPANMSDSVSSYVLGVLQREDLIMPVLNLEQVLSDAESASEFGQALQNVGRH